MIRSILAFLLLLAPAPPAAAVEPTALPEFSVQTAAGAWVQSADLVPEASPGRPGLEPWILVYARPGGAGWGALLAALEPLGDPGSRVAVIAGSTSPEELARELAGREKLGGLRWSVDPGDTARDALPGSAVPVTFGLRGDVIEWDLAGLAGGAAEYRALLQSWLAR